MQIAVVTDAWHPQINGVVRTLGKMQSELKAMGHKVRVFAPEAFRCLPCPTYPEIPLALFPRRRLSRMLDDFAADAVHIATEGPLGFAARHYCLKTGRPLTTSYHTRFPE